ncbi:MAG TPA: hypothetical protein EYQ75_21220 [Planctomycetaceae bacterium]|nr:hypothetical protein [Planctomycetaceae bacterium]
MRWIWMSGLVLVFLIPACARFSLYQGASSDSNPHELSRGQLVFHSDFRLPQRHRLIEELESQRQQLANLLKLPVSDEPIHVFLFENAGRYREFTSGKFPQLPERRAFFVKSDTQLAVFAFWGNRIAEDLRHEVTHGYVHAVVPEIPLWLDEGIAEYMEVPRGRQGFHRRHTQSLFDHWRKHNWRPDLRRLEQLATLDQMSIMDYAESWLWVHFMLQTKQFRGDLLQNYLARLRVTGLAPPLSHELFLADPVHEDAIMSHLAFLVEQHNLPSDTEFFEPQ